MKINWRVRLVNPCFWVQIGLAIITPILAYFGLTGADLTSWQIFAETFKNAILNPYVCFLVLVSVFNALQDPTTKGMNDSAKALTYIVPSK